MEKSVHLIFGKGLGTIAWGLLRGEKSLAKFFTTIQKEF